MPIQEESVAIIGMACRFPKAPDLEGFWANLCAGVEAITFFTDEELRAAGVEPRLLADPAYVKARPVLEHADAFDAAFFGFSPREAEIMAPQHRLFLECAWAGLEHAGYDTARHAGRVGVYAGSGMNTYFIHNLLTQPELLAATDIYQLVMSNDKDFVSTRVSYELNLRGPSLGVQSSCSSSLVAVHFACQSLLSAECDLALAGGTAVLVPQTSGHLFREGSVLSPDGHCRTFDEKAQGTIFGSGVGLVVLKRLSEAVRDGDFVHAVVKGSAINNDGGSKIGYTAPSLEGQAEVIGEALSMAGVSADTIGYVEAHGTATALGDPIEVAALTRAFRAHTQRSGFCGIGSVKSNFGHLDAAAGIAGLIKVALSLYHKTLPPSLHFESPNRKIDFAASPFIVNTTRKAWPAPPHPRRAGVSSFGVGGTNAHVVLEEPPAPAASGPSRPYLLLLLSAKTERALEVATERLHTFLGKNKDVPLADVAYTLQLGRKAFDHRRMILGADTEDALNALVSRDPNRRFTAPAAAKRQVVFMFPGLGPQYEGMGRGLYESEPVFRQEIDRCASLLARVGAFDLLAALYPADATTPGRTAALRRPAVGMPAVFAIEYALASLWLSWGIKPDALIGHSLGEYAAACLAGVFSLEDALAVVALRGRLLEQTQPGSMLAVPLAEEEVRSLLPASLSLATVNAPRQCVVAGDDGALRWLETALAARGVECQRLRIDIAAHSEAVMPILDTFTRFLRGVSLRPPRVPYISNVTGTWTTAAQASSPEYWARHLRETVRFSAGLAELLRGEDRIFVEVGPGHTLSTLVRQQNAVAAPPPAALPSLRHPKDPQPDAAFLQRSLGLLWCAGVEPDWHAFYARERRRRVPLPTYPFERRRFWVEGRVREGAAVGEPAAPAETPAPRADGRHPRPALPNCYIAPRSDDEAALARLWEELFGIEPVGVGDDFFALGGNSLLATQLASRIRGTLLSDVPLRTLFEHTTIAGLASAIASRRASAAPPGPAPHPAASAPQELLERLDELSDAQVDSLLVDMLRERTAE